MDAYYASVEVRDQPRLRGLPVIVGGSASGRGVVCAASYEARQFGVHSAMPAVTARRLCPHGVFLPPRMSHYAEVSRQIREIFRSLHTARRAALAGRSLSSMFNGSQRLFGRSIEIARRIKEEILNELQLVASVGVAPNKFLAKVASDLDKPDGFVVVPEDGVQAFLDPLLVGRLWGVGKVTNASLERIGVRTIGQLRALPLTTLTELYGEQGEHLHRLAHGLDPRAVVPDRRAKSLSHETTFAKDIEDEEVLQAWLWELAEQVGRRLRACELFGETVHLKVRLRDFRTFTRSQKLTNPTNVTKELAEVACTLFQQRVDRERLPIRLVGVGVSQLSRGGLRQKLLFEETTHETERDLDAARDEITAKFGSDALVRAARLLHPPPPRDDRPQHGP